MNITEHVQQQHAEDLTHTTPAKAELSKQGGVPHLQIERILRVEMLTLPKLICKLIAFFIKLPKGFFEDIGKPFLKWYGQAKELEQPKKL